jgi:hypothetical protein
VGWGAGRDGVILSHHVTCGWLAGWLAAGAGESQGPAAGAPGHLCSAGQASGGSGAEQDRPRVSATPPCHPCGPGGHDTESSHVRSCLSTPRHASVHPNLRRTRCMDVTYPVQRRVEAAGGDLLAFEAGEDLSRLFGRDPAPGLVKELRIRYICIGSDADQQTSSEETTSRGFQRNVIARVHGEVRAEARDDPSNAGCSRLQSAIRVTSQKAFPVGGSWPPCLQGRTHAARAYPPTRRRCCCVVSCWTWLPPSTAHQTRSG